MTKLTKAIVELVDDKDNKVASYIVKRLNVRSAIRRENMFMNIQETEMSIRGQMFACASLACTLYDENDKLVFPEKDYPENTAIDELFDYDYEVYLALSKAYLEVNPVAPTLSAKKKKS